MRALGYARLSKANGDDVGAGLIAQRDAIEAACRHRRWTLAGVLDDNGRSGASMRRPAVQEVLRRLDAGEADALVVSRLDRLSRSVVDFGQLIERSRRRGWGVVVLDMDVDTTTPTGELIANVVVSVAQFERRMIGQRTKDALAVKGEQGIVPGPKRQIAADVRARIVRERKRGRSLARIATALNDRGVPTVKPGARWHPATVRHALRQEGLR